MQLKDHKIIQVDMRSIGGSALTDSALSVPETESEGIPITYVPARNTVFLSYALAWAEVLQADAIFIGVNALDYSAIRIAGRNSSKHFRRWQIWRHAPVLRGKPAH